MLDFVSPASMSVFVLRLNNKSGKIARPMVGYTYVGLMVALGIGSITAVAPVLSI